MGDFRPDWAIHPGRVLVEKLEDLGMSQTELAGATGHSLKHINQVCRGHVAVSARFALHLERVLNVSAEFWLGMQMKWDLHRARQFTKLPDEVPA